MNLPEELELSTCVALLQMAGEKELKDRLHLLSESLFFTQKKRTGKKLLITEEGKDAEVSMASEVKTAIVAGS